MNTQHQIIIHAALHARGWSPGTDWFDLAEDITGIYQTVREYSEDLAVPAPDAQAVKDWLGWEQED